MGLIKLRDIKECQTVTDALNQNEENGDKFIKLIDEKTKTLFDKIQKDEIKNNVDSLSYINDNFTPEEILFLANVHIVERYQQSSNPMAQLMAMMGGK